jgi:guanylate kinase
MGTKEIQPSTKRGRLVILSGVSAGAGKDTLLKMFLKKHPDWQNPPSATTRRPRPGETDGLDYYFMEELEFKDKSQAGDFLETDFHAGSWYGTLRKPIYDILESGRDVIVRKDVNGAISIKKLIPKTIVIFIDVENADILERRLRGRQADTEEQIQRRLELAKKEQEFKDHFDHIVVNVHNHPQNALTDIEKALNL